MSKLKIALQKTGRLSHESLRLLDKCSIRFSNEARQLQVAAENFPLEILFLRNSDIPQYLADGVADVAIIGENTLVEKEQQVTVVQKLGFARCRVSLAVPRHINTDSPNYFQGRKIATSYPNTLNRFLAQHNISAEVHVISGSVEIAPGIGLADGICDIVSSGSTLLRNGLRETCVILRSEAVLARTQKLPPAKETILAELVFRIKAVLRARQSRYILMNVPDVRIGDVSRILPVLKSPTVMPLARKGWSSLHSVIDEDRFWEVINELKKAGAEDILILPIDRMVL